MKLRSHIFASLSLAFIFSSCAKNKVESSPEMTNSTLYLKSISFIGGDRVYTNVGEIQDPNVKSKALISTGLNLISHPTPLPKDSINVYKTSSLKIGNTTYLMEKKNNAFILTDNNVHDSEDPLLLRLAPFKKYNNLSEKVPGHFSYSEQFVAFGDPLSEMYISGMDICLLSRNASTGKIIERAVVFNLNEFNMSGISSLGARDTVAVREYRYNYSKK